MIHVSEDDLDEVAAIIEDDVMRAILAETSVKPMSVNELAERVDASKPTIYRRLQTLEELDVIEGRTRLDEAGDHYDVYAATFHRLTVELNDGEYDFHIERSEPMADRFTRFIEQM